MFEKLWTCSPTTGESKTGSVLANSSRIFSRRLNKTEKIIYLFSTLNAMHRENVLEVLHTDAHQR